MKLYTMRCAACNLDLGRVTQDQADDIGADHAPHCTATVAEYDQALARVKHALATGDTSRLG